MLMLPDRSAQLQADLERSVDEEKGGTPFLSSGENQRDGNRQNLHFVVIGLEQPAQKGRSIILYEKDQWKHESPRTARVLEGLHLWRRLAGLVVMPCAPCEAKQLQIIRVIYSHLVEDANESSSSSQAGRGICPISGQIAEADEGLEWKRRTVHFRTASQELRVAAHGQ